MTNNNFSPEKYVLRLNKQMEKYTEKKHLIKNIDVNEQIINPKKDICNYNDLLLNNPLKRDTKKIFKIKRGVENDEFFK
jgi:hypothetical protein